MKYYIDDSRNLSKGEIKLMSQKLIKVIVVLSFSDILRLKKEYSQESINKLPFKLSVGSTTWLVPESYLKKLINILA